MSLPKQLVECFEKINLLNIHENLTKENVKTFVELLNRAIPSAMNPVSYAIYRFNRTKYIADKTRFVKEIKDFPPYNSMILWTDFKDILSAFKLEDKIFLGWDKNNNRYRAYLINENATVEVKADEASKDYSDQMHDDIDRIYDYMQSRIAQCNQSA